MPCSTIRYLTISPHSLLHLRDHSSSKKKPPLDPPSSSLSLHLDLQALLEQLLKTPLTGYSYRPVTVCHHDLQDTCDLLNHCSQCPCFTLPAHILDAIRHTHTHNWVHTNITHQYHHLPYQQSIPTPKAACSLMFTCQSTSPGLSAPLAAVSCSWRP